MYKSELGNHDDVLWGNESMTSANCRYLLKMHNNGNLALHGLKGAYKTFVMLWETHTKLYNYSSGSIAKLFMENGKVVVNEYHFKALQSRAITLWQSNASVMFESSNEMVLTLTDDGCVELKTAYKARLIWNVCGALGDDDDGDSTQTSTAVQSDSSDDGTDSNFTQSSAANGELWWISILVVALLCAIVFAVFAIRKYFVAKSMSSSRNDRKSFQREQAERDEELENSQSLQPIEQWAKQTFEKKGEGNLDVDHEYGIELAAEKAHVVDETNYISEF